MENKECDCLKNLEEMVIKRAKENSEKLQGYKIVESDWEHRSWYPKVRLYVNYILKYTFTKKDGTESKPKNEHMSIFFTYCPFCGKKYEVDKKEEE